MHVLSTPPAFVLSQNQTLRRNFDWLDRCSKQLPKLTCRGVVKLPGPAHWRTNHAAHNLALSSHPAYLIREYLKAFSNVRRRAGPTLLKSFLSWGRKSRPDSRRDRPLDCLSRAASRGGRDNTYQIRRVNRFPCFFRCFFLPSANALKTLILRLLVGLRSTETLVWSCRDG